MEPLNFDYNVYDRQLTNLLKMSEVMLDGWDDYSITELNCDLRSLRTKAARLCAMADLDASLQRDDLMHSRSDHNARYASLFATLVYERLKPLLSRVVDNIRQGNRHVEHLPEMKVTDISDLLPQLAGILPPEEENRDDWTSLTVEVRQVESQYKKKYKPTAFPGMPIVERLLCLLQYFTLVCYLLFLFKRMEAHTREDITEDEAVRRLLQFIKQYGESEAGAQSMRLYQKTLSFENAEQPLTVEQLRREQYSLHLKVPESLRLCFIDHIHDLPAMASSLLHSQTSNEDLLALVDAVAKWQWLNQEIYAIEHPTPAQVALFNRVLTVHLHNHSIDLARLRDHIRQYIIPLITRKNQWFCLWCVLRHRSLLQSDSFAAFTEQMMHPDWFGDVPAYLHLTDDILRAYSGYLSTTDFNHWDEDEFQAQAKRLGKQKKWNLTLFRTFRSLCDDIDDALTEWRKS